MLRIVSSPSAEWNKCSLVERSIKQVNWGKDWLIKVENPHVIRSSKRLVAVDGAASVRG